MISITIDSKQFTKDMDDVAMSQMPYALARTLNTCAEDVQAAEQEHVARSFTLRRPTWVMNTIMMNRADYATKDNLRAMVRINPDRDVLSKFEDLGEKHAMFAGHAIAIPIDAKRGKNDIVTPANRPRAFQLKPINSKTGNKIAQGIHGTFLVQKPDGTGSIFQRIGKRVSLLYVLKPRVPLPRNLAFAETAKRVVAERLPINWAKWFAEAMRTAR